MGRANTHEPTEIVGAKIPVDLKAQLVALAHRRERNISQEVRLAIRSHLAVEQSKEELS